MSKIIQAANTMISHPEKITGVILQGREGYFLYGPYKWSVSTNGVGDIYWLTYYPTESTLESIARAGDLPEEEKIVYSSRDIGTKEAFQTFRDLYLMVKEKAVGVHDVLNDIIKDDEAPF